VQISSPHHDFWWAMLWIARFLGLVIVVAFAGGTVADVIRDGVPIFEPRDAVWFVLFPFGVCVGYVIALRRELLGAVVSLGCIGALYAGQALVGHRPTLVPLLVPFGGPALFMLLHWMFAPGARQGRGA
jgi:hypothetical protein